MFLNSALRVTQSRLGRVIRNIFSMLHQRSWIISPLIINFLSFPLLQCSLPFISAFRIAFEFRAASIKKVTDECFKKCRFLFVKPVHTLANNDFFYSYEQKLWTQIRNWRSWTHPWSSCSPAWTASRQMSPSLKIASIRLYPSQTATAVPTCMMSSTSWHWTPPSPWVMILHNVGCIMWCLWGLFFFVPLLIWMH